MFRLLRGWKESFLNENLLLSKEADKIHFCSFGYLNWIYWVFGGLTKKWQKSKLVSRNFYCKFWILVEFSCKLSTHMGGFLWCWKITSFACFQVHNHILLQKAFKIEWKNQSLLEIIHPIWKAFENFRLISNTFFRQTQLSHQNRIRIKINNQNHIPNRENSQRKLPKYEKTTSETFFTYKNYICTTTIDGPKIHFNDI